MVQTEAAKEPVKPLSAEEILRLARAVDEITQEEFKTRNRASILPQPKHSIVSETGIRLLYENSVDGRVVAIQFIHYLAERNGEFYVARPYLISSNTLTVKDLERWMEDALKFRMGKRKEDLFAAQTLLDVAELGNYSSGRVELKDGAGNVKYIISGTVPDTLSVSISTPIASRERNQGELYRMFLGRLSTGF